MLYFFSRFYLFSITFRNSGGEIGKKSGERKYPPLPPPPWIRSSDINTNSWETDFLCVYVLCVLDLMYEGDCKPPQLDCQAFNINIREQNYNNLQTFHGYYRKLPNPFPL